MLPKEEISEDQKHKVSYLKRKQHISGLYECYPVDRKIPITQLHETFIQGDCTLSRSTFGNNKTLSMEIPKGHCISRSG